MGAILIAAPLVPRGGKCRTGKASIVSMRIRFAKNSQKVLIDRQISPLSSLDRKGLNECPLLLSSGVEFDRNPTAVGNRGEFIRQINPANGMATCVVALLLISIP